MCHTHPKNSEIIMSSRKERSQAPLHFYTKAQNARFCAYAISHLDKPLLFSLAASSDYYDDVQIATREGFMREASISLELIIKAVIAQKNENTRRDNQKKVSNVPQTHDVLQLWQMAGLETLSEDDQYRLAIVKRSLNWSSRYAAPKNDKGYTNEKKEIAPYMQVTHEFESGLRIKKGYPFGFSEFDALYQIANDKFWQLRSQMDK